MSEKYGASLPGINYDPTNHQKHFLSGRKIAFPPTYSEKKRNTDTWRLSRLLLSQLARNFPFIISSLVPDQ